MGKGGRGLAVVVVALSVLGLVGSRVARAEEDVATADINPDDYEGPLKQIRGDEEDGEFGAIYGVLDELDPTDILVIDFYQTWCPACKAWMPHYEASGKYFLASTKDTPRVVFAKASCGDENKQLCWAYDIHAYPSFVAGTPDQHRQHLHEFDGDTYTETVPEGPRQDRVKGTKLKRVQASQFLDYNAKCVIDAIRKHALREKFIKKVTDRDPDFQGPQEDVSHLGIPEECTNAARQKEIADSKKRMKLIQEREKRWARQDKDSLWYKLKKGVQKKLHVLLKRMGSDYRFYWVEDQFNWVEPDFKVLAEQKTKEDKRRGRKSEL
ncbi:thioredoxin domain-containing protein [Chloropicon primus]|uniref:Thioredoxin domain-containing protein n=1 Tax=Chloropicon primus TaxID=1764295 RepID=A0A5B8MDH3_9CHLO|nr:hypothetical protein A3770_01p09770 [Chloropicon primus]UPQ97668.1 thioredoxin domain-containing protein [Chloropicon primus]|eukprot:QDZ18459.1 hypothetical protein A3770_01p09770 [Chloropicon primus]